MDTVNEALAIFQSLDKNGDGTLDLVELNDGLSDFGLTDAYIQTIFFDLDTNSDGQVSKEGSCGGTPHFTHTSKAIQIPAWTETESHLRLMLMLMRRYCQRRSKQMRHQRKRSWWHN